MNQERGRIYTHQALEILRNHMQTVPKNLRATTTVMLANHLMKSAEKYRGVAMGGVE